MINKIGVENFRVFKNYTEFEIRPITLLTGSNNTGKSSFTKLLLLLKNGIEKLDFQIGNHNLESFDKVLNWENRKNGNEVLKLSFPTDIVILDDSYHMQIDYFNGKVKKINIKNHENSLLEFDILKNIEPENNFTFNIKDLNENTVIKMKELEVVAVLNFKINTLIDLIYNNGITDFYRSFISPDLFSETTLKKGTLNNMLNYSENHLLKLKANKNLASEMYKLLVDSNCIKKKLLFSTLKEKPKSAMTASLVICPDRIYALINEIEKLNKNYLLYDVFINGESISNTHLDDIIEKQTYYYSNLNTQKFKNLNHGFKNIKSIFSEALFYANNNVKLQLANCFKTKFDTQNVEVKETALGNLIFLEKIYEKESVISETNEFQQTLFGQILKTTDILKSKFDQVDFISANRGSQKRVLGNKSENEIDQIILNYAEMQNNSPLNLNSNKENLLNEILNILEIEGTIEIERHENYISIVYIKNGDIKVNLADLGYGYSQLIPIILKTINHNDNGILIIEEPEANLHPNLQSKLADVFIAFNKHLPGIKFIIETHSEYFIRKLQYLTAKKEIKTNQSVIYYFNADKHVNKIEPKIKMIEITDNGNLTDNFGPGFYDEVTRLQFDLMKLNSEQN